MPEGKKIQDIENGTVIDRIEPEMGRAISKALMIEGSATGFAYKSSKMSGGKKDIYKAEGFFPEETEMVKIALLSPGCTVNIIREGEVAEKRVAEIPDEINGFLGCPNGNCITNAEKVPLKVYHEKAGGEHRFRCRYCETEFEKDDIREKRLLTYLD